MNEIQTSEIKQIELEINFYKEQTAKNIIEIGKRLIKAKEMLPHGEWGKWLEEKVEFRQTTATKYMRAAKEFPNLQSLENLGQTKIFALLEVPQEEREEFIENNHIEDMTTRELQQAIKEKKELEKQIEELKNQEPTIIEKEVEKIVQVIPSDYESLKGFQQLHANQCYENSKLEGEIQRLKRSLTDSNFELSQLKSQQELLERKAKLNDDEAKKYKQLKDQIETLSQQKDDLGRQIKARTELSGLVVRIEHILKTELAPIKYSRAINEASTDEVVVNNLRDIVGRVQDWCNEMIQYIPTKNYKDFIEMEVIENEQ